VADFDAELAYRTGLLRRETRSFGLSLGDRACLALALREKLPVFTTDRRWRELRLGIEINVLR
jgi:PIN domain nuclease of toxin-antitoxin system